MGLFLAQKSPQFIWMDEQPDILTYPTILCTSREIFQRAPKANNIRQSRKSFAALNFAKENVIILLTLHTHSPFKRFYNNNNNNKLLATDSWQIMRETIYDVGTFVGVFLLFFRPRNICSEFRKTGISRNNIGLLCQDHQYQPNSIWPSLTT